MGNGEIQYFRGLKTGNARKRNTENCYVFVPHFLLKIYSYTYEIEMEKTGGRLISDGLKAGNFSLIGQFFNGTGASNGGTIAKIKDALKNGNLGALLAGGGGSGGQNGSAIIEKIKVRDP